MYMYHKHMDADGMFHGICLCSNSLGCERWCRLAHVDISRNIVESGECHWVTAVASLQISTARILFMSAMCKKIIASRTA